MNAEFPPDLEERYELVRKLGSGGMGLVFLVRDKTLGKTVVIKTLSTTTPTQEQLVSFQKEARAAGRLQHPQIIATFDFGITGSGNPYMVLEYVPGRTLKEAIESRSTLSLRSILTIIEKLARAMAHAHDSGIIHRDLKPSNILLIEGENSEVDIKVIDFGIAHLFEIEPGKGFESSGGKIIGSPPYMSPEAVRGETATRSSDIYSMGCLVFEIFTGAPPFRDKSPMITMKMQLEKKAPRLDRTLEKLCREDAIAHELADLIDRCLAKDPGQRPTDMHEVAEIVAGMLADLHSENQDQSAVRARVIELGKVDLYGRSNLAFSPTLSGSGLGRRGLVTLLILIGAGAAGAVYMIDQNARKSSSEAVTGRSGPVPSSEVLVQGLGEYTTGFDTMIKDEDLEGGKLELTDLRTLDLASSAITDRGAGSLPLYKQQIILDLTRTRITDRALTPIATMSSLHKIYLRGTAVTDEGLEKLIGMPGLDSLDLGYTGITDRSVKSMSEEMSLREIRIDHCPGVTLDGVRSLSRAPKLAKLRLGDEKESKLKALQGGEEIVQLTASESVLDSKDVEALAKLPKLRTLILNRSRIDRQTFLALARLKSLLKLSITGCPGLDEADVARFKAINGYKTKVQDSVSWMH
ncbi:MAG: protein kinase [Cyanobacteria bacterium HKST-UBA02]|nr:protein kinase [Cyanobacteria bacterium HKST-UBA02]